MTMAHIRFGKMAKRLKKKVSAPKTLPTAANCADFIAGQCRMLENELDELYSTNCKLSPDERQRRIMENEALLKIFR